MYSKKIIEVYNLGKCYHVYEKPHHRLMQMLLGRGGRSYYREFWAVRNVSFAIAKGRIVGVLGKNGAGKSTLLQIICGTLSPTHGAVDVQGRVAALLELGSGFNPEFTGIENIYMNGQILGLTRKEIDAKLGDILAFADIGDFVNQPVKTYSSGMFARLAFAVVIHVDPDVLVIDEALSVGDAWFQHKSMARMRRLMESGCTVLFVSHSIESVRALCHEAIWLDQGEIKMQGNVTDVTNAYMNDVFIEQNRITLQASALPIAEESDEPFDAQTNAPGDEVGYDSSEIELAAARLDGAAVLNVRSKRLRNSKGEVVDRIEQGERFAIEFELEILRAINDLSVGFLIKDQFGQELTGESYFNTYRQGLDLDTGRFLTFVFTSQMLLRGGQSYSVALRVNQVRKWDRSDNIVIYADEVAMVFDVLADPENPMWFKFRMPFEVRCE
jgi:lipopolysaccharide transport system ATP-binding protein